MKHRNPITGQFEKPWYSLVLHDFGNLGFQVLRTSQDKRELEEEAENLNHVFIQAGRSKQFEAQVCAEKE